MNQYDERFDKWRDSLPKEHWARYDLSACKLGWDAAIAATTPRTTRLERALRIVSNALKLRARA